MTPAIASVHAFIDAFNAQDHEALATTLNYSHVRLAGGAFTTVATAEEFVARSKKGNPIPLQLPRREPMIR